MQKSSEQNLAQIDLYKELLKIRIDSEDSEIKIFNVLMGDTVIASGLKRQQLSSKLMEIS